MHFGMPSLIEINSLEETASLCKELGLDFIELSMNFPQFQIENLEHAEEFKSIAEKYGIFYTLHLEENLNVCDFNRDISKTYIETVKKTIRVAKILKIPVLNMHMKKGVYITLEGKKTFLYEKYNDRYMSDIEDFKEMCEKEIGNEAIKISIENTDGYLDFEKKAIEELLKSDVFTLTWDIGHSHKVNDIDEEFIMKHSDKLIHFHMHDAKKNEDHLALGSGEIDLDQRFRVAEKYGCRCLIEEKTIKTLRESVKWIKMK